MENFNFTAEAIAAVTGLGLTLFFAYFPKVRLWFAALASEVKSYIMLGLLLVAETIIGLLAYYGVIPTSEPVTWTKLLTIAFSLLVSNQPTYALLPEARGVKEIRVTRDTKYAKDLAKRLKEEEKSK